MKRRRVKKVPILLTFLTLIILIFGCLYIFRGSFTRDDTKDDNESEVEEEKTLNYSGNMTLAGNVLVNSNMWYDTLGSDGTYDFNYVFENLKSSIKTGVNIYTQQSIVGGKALGSSLNYDYNSPVEEITAMKDMGFNLVSFASYHAYDRGLDGINNSIQYCKENALLYSGISTSEESRLENIKLTKNGITYALLSYTINTDETYTDTYVISKYSEELVKKDVDAIKNTTDIIIVSIDWSDSSTNLVTEIQKEIATYLSEIGVNIVIGNNSFVVEPIEKINNTLVFYSLGNLLSGHTSIDSRISMVVDLDVNVAKTGDKKEVTFDNINVLLTYAYNQFKTNYKVIPFTKITNELSNYKTYYDKYSAIIKGNNDYINVYSLGE